MSAFVCGKHIFERILSAIITYKDRMKNAVPKWDGKSIGTLDDIGNELYRMNVDSVNFLYANHKPMKFVPYDGFAIKKMSKVRLKSQLVDACRSIHSWQYQSCELDDWQSYWQWKLVKTLENILNCELLRMCGKEVSEDAESNSREVKRLECYNQSQVWGN